jgi:hypothetical protein
MPIILKCGNCQGRFKAPENLAGKRVRCKCGTVLAVPAIAPKATPPEPEIADLSGLIDGTGFDAASCPGCGTSLPDDAVICTACGFNKKTGQRMSVKVEEGGSAAGPTKEKTKSNTKPAKIVTEESGKGSMGAAVGKFIKLLLIFGVLGGLGYGGYLVKEAFSLDPRKQSQEALAKINNGMTIAQVVGAMGGPPKEVYAMQDPPEGSKGFPQEKKIGYADNFLKHHGPKKLKYGFKFAYLFSERDQLHVHFSPNGLVTDKELFDPLKMLGM